MVVRFLLLSLLCFVMPVRAVTVLDVSPLQATPADMVNMSVHFEQGQRLEAVRTYRYGSSIQVYILLSDVVSPGQPPAPARTQEFDIGQFPPGAYRIDIYRASFTATLIASRQLGVTAPPPIPVAAPGALIGLALLVVLAGCVAMRTRAISHA